MNEVIRIRVQPRQQIKDDLASGRDLSRSTRARTEQPRDPPTLHGPLPRERAQVDDRNAQAVSPPANTDQLPLDTKVLYRKSFSMGHLGFSKCSKTGQPDRERWIGAIGSRLAVPSEVPVGSCSSNSKGGREFSHRLTGGSQPTQLLLTLNSQLLGLGRR